MEIGECGSDWVVRTGELGRRCPALGSAPMADSGPIQPSDLCDRKGQAIPLPYVSPAVASRAVAVGGKRGVRRGNPVV